jgi:diacylglycerol kinase (ATP)
MSSARPALVLINPHAGGGRARRLQPRIAAWLGREAPGVCCVVADDVAAAHAAIAAAGTGARIVLVGGDGTVHRMLPALVAGGCTLALVPQGSGNDTARALGVARLGWQAALRLALDGPASPMDLGECRAGERTTLFASSLTAGFDSAVGERALHGPPALRGLPRYLWATLREVAALRHWPLRVEADGQLLHDGPALFSSVLNTRTYGSGMPAAPHARIDDGRLDLVVAGRFSRAGTLAMLPRLLAGRHLGHPQVLSRPFTEMTVTCPVDVPLAGDGEAAGMARAWQIRVLPGALRAVRHATDPA